MQWGPHPPNKRLGQLGKIHYVKRKATTKAKPAILNFEEIKQQYLMGIKAVVEMAEISYDLIINCNQTAIKYVPVSECSKRFQTC